MVIMNILIYIFDSITERSYNKGITEICFLGGCHEDIVK